MPDLDKDDDDDDCEPSKKKKRLVKHLGRGFGKSSWKTRAEVQAEHTTPKKLNKRPQPIKEKCHLVMSPVIHLIRF